MKRKYLSVLSFLALLVCLTTAGVVVAQAQTRDKYLVSAKAGGINFVSGNVTVVRKGTRNSVAVTDQDNLENGDVVTTGMGGRVEVLLNPGSYMRLAENSEFEMTDTSLEHLRIKLLSGSAIIEVVGTDDAQLSLEVLTPQTNAVIVKRGIYRFNVLQSGTTEVLVRKGRAIVGPYAQEVKGGKMVTISRGSTAVLAKIDKRAPDSLEYWSRERAEYLASINRSITPSATLDYSADIFANTDYNNRYRRGAWVYDSRRNCYVFLPGRGGSSSPYGYGYQNWGRCCTNGPGRETPDNPAPNPQGGGNPVAGGGGTPPPDAPTGRGRGRPRDPDSGSRNRPYEPTDGEGGRGRSEPPISRPDSPSPVSRPAESAPVSRPDPPSAPSAPVQSSPPPSSPPPSAPPPSEAPSRTEAPAMRESPND